MAKTAYEMLHGKSRGSFGFRLKWLLIKALFLVGAVIFAGHWALNTTVGDSVELIKDLKGSIKEKLKVFATEKQNALEQKVRLSLGIPTKGAAPANYPSTKTPDVPLMPPQAPPVPGQLILPGHGATSPQVGKPTSSNVQVSDLAKELPAYELGFYYDNTNAPAPLEKSLALIERASQVWEHACNVRFVFKGEKHADYLSTDKTVAGQFGVIKWATQLDGDAIGEAHMGTVEGPVKNFVMELHSDYFKNKKEEEVVLTATHEFGHVIGLDHSNNRHSLMYFQSGSKQQLQSSDQAMCLYLRARWSGVSHEKAANKYGLVF